MEEKKVLLLGLNPFSGNRGVGALAYSVIYLLEKVSKENNKTFKYYVTVPIDKYKHSITMEGAEIELHSINIPVFHQKMSLVKAVASPSRFKELASMDYVFAMGEGDSFSDIYGVERFNDINSPIQTCSSLGRKIMFLPQTIGPFKSESIKEKAAKTLSAADKVLVRDSLSFDCVTELNLGINHTELIDVAFFMPFAKTTFDADKLHVGINISALQWYGGYTKSNQFNLKSDYQKLITGLIDYFLEKENVVVHLVPHVVLPDRNVENDYAVSRDIQLQYSNDRLVIAPFFLDPIDAKTYVSGLDYFTGARMHACIAAFSSGVPVIPMAYSRKFNGLFAKTLGYDEMADMVNESDDKVLFDTIVKGFDRREELKNKILDIKNTKIKTKYSNLLKELNDFVKD